ncbi:MAG TPA: TonB-dependent receptor, partial [Myxococcota bacterium]|nr:TonB-dependent receptor [Myxococcota bacterium]
FDVFSQELRLVGSLLDGSLNYVGGFYYARDDHDHSQRTEQQLQLPAAAFGGACVPGIPGFSGPTDPSGLFIYCVLPTSFAAQATFLTNKSWALFGSLEYELPWIEGLRANFGVRYIDETKKFKTAFFPITNSTLVGSTLGAPLLSLSGLEDSWDDVVFEAGVNYQVTESLLAYYRFAQGFRSGGFSLRGSDPANWPITFAPEDVDSHEVGFKTSWLDGRLIANLAGFYSKIKGAQFSSIISGVTIPGTNTLILNGDLAKIYGVELQTSFELLEGLNANFNLGWQDYSDVTSTQNTHNLPAAAGNTVCFQVFGGTSEATCPTTTFVDQDLTRVPELTWSVGVDYRRDLGPGEIVLGSRVRKQDTFWIISPSSTTAAQQAPPPAGLGLPPVTNTPVRQGDYTLLDANISYEFQIAERSVRVGFVGKNLTDKQYKEQELPLGPGGFRGWGPPRYLGGELQLEL